MVAIETTNETTQPTIRIASSIPDIEAPSSMNFSTLTRLAPSIVGIAIKKENSAAAEREVPISIPPRMVEPERDVPACLL